MWLCRSPNSNACPYHSVSTNPHYSETHTTFPHIWTFLLHVSKRCIFLNMFDTVVYVSCFNRDGDTLLRYFPRSGPPFLSSFSSWLKEFKKKKKKKISDHKHIPDPCPRRRFFLEPDAFHVATIYDTCVVLADSHVNKQVHRCVFTCNTRYRSNSYYCDKLLRMIQVSFSSFLLLKSGVKREADCSLMSGGLVDI